jgi:outer membrane protein
MAAMRHGIALCALATLLFGSQALAQYQNNSIGLNVGYLDLDEAQGLNWAIPLGLHASRYFDANVEGTAHAIGLLAQVPISQKYAFGFLIQLGARYLFMTEAIRPYAGAHFSFFNVFADNAQYQYGGVGANAGVDYFLNDAWSIGVRGQANLYLTLNAPATWSYGLSLEISTWY